MRIITHNFLQCPQTRTYPLRLVPTEVETIETRYNADFIQSMLSRLDWTVLRDTCHELSLGELPEQAPKSESDAPEAFKLLHTVLLETHVKSGHLVNREGTQYTIFNGIPDMLNARTADNKGDEDVAAAPASEARDGDNDHTTMET